MGAGRLVDAGRAAGRRVGRWLDGVRAWGYRVLDTVPPVRRTVDALVRIEAPHEVDTPEEIDRIAGWLMSERLPRATADPRWPTLLYPIHYLEAILKRRLAALVPPGKR